MPEAFIIDAVRTPVGRRGGGLATAHPADLGAHVIQNLLARTHAAEVDDEIRERGEHRTTLIQRVRIATDHRH